MSGQKLFLAPVLVFMLVVGLAVLSNSPVSATPTTTLPTKSIELAPFISQPVQTVGETFWTEQVKVAYQSGQVILSGGPAPTGLFAVDDGMTLVVTRPDGTTVTWSYNFSNGCTGVFPSNPVDLSSFFQPGSNTVAVSLYDLCGFNEGTAGPIYVTFDVPSLVSLAFPLASTNPYSARITSVFDHAMATPYPYSCDHSVEAYTSELGNANSSTWSAGCGHGYSQSSGAAFFVDGHYQFGTDRTYLYSDGHPGFDYPTPVGSNVYAAASGTISYPTSIVDTAKASAFHILELDPDGFANYKIYYLHLCTYPNPTTPTQAGNPCPPSTPLPAGTHVNVGDWIALSGSWANGSPTGTAPHLHLEVQNVVPIGQVPASFRQRYQCFLPQGGRDPNNACVPVDPYGWDGTGNDPYASETGVSNVRLWSYTPTIDSVSIAAGGSGSYTLALTGEGFTSGMVACLIAQASVGPTCTSSPSPQDVNNGFMSVQVSLTSGSYRLGVATVLVTGAPVLASNWQMFTVP